MGWGEHREEVEGRQYRVVKKEVREVAAQEEGGPLLVAVLFAPTSPVSEAQAG